MKVIQKIIPGETCLQLFLIAASPLQGMLDRPGITHEFCNSQALQILRNDGFTRYAGYLQQFRRELNLGVYWADKGWKNIHHYYEPKSGRGLWHFAGAIEQFAAYYRLAFHTLRRGDQGKAAFLIGTAAHLVQDLCVPHHARGKLFDGHKQYESWAETRYADYAVSSQGVYGEGRPAFSLLEANAAIAADFLDAVKQEGDEPGYRRATAVLLPLAQRTTAGLLWRFAAEAAKTGAMPTDKKRLDVA
ncbi:MAG TPA: zinc dependent phospholipase C family protein, partial [Negativicutes bacterium]|nr:zinc dependent phospholipase C family protein [Negativicutes bacterium]